MKRISLIISVIFTVATILYLSSCASSDQLAESKSGAQLWGENCVRCHNAPSPDTFSDSDWDVAVLHMRMRANLTEHEAINITEFLKTAN